MKRRAHTNILNKREAESVIRMQQELTIISLRQYVAYGLLALFALNTISALTIIFLVGFGQMILSEKLIITVLVETVAQAAAVFLSVTKYLFPASSNPQEKLGKRGINVRSRQRHL